MRYHPLTIVYLIYQLIKNSFIPALFLFVIRGKSEFWLIEYGRYAFILFVGLRLIFIIWSWFNATYDWEKQTFYFKKGIFVKKTSTIPFSKIQNVTRHTTIFHKVFGLTSITFETAMDGEDDSIKFTVLTKKQAAFLLDLVKVEEKHTKKTNEKEPNQEENANITEHKEINDRVVHFSPSKQDLWKASFTSLSFLAFIPLIFGVYEYIEPFFPDKEQVEGIFDQILTSTWLVLAMIVMVLILGIVIGVIRTFIRYGKYEISSNGTYIFIDRGLINESYFMIEKRKIQGVEIEQSFIKRLIGLAEVKIVSSASPQSDDSKVQVNSLYPFLPIDQAYSLIGELIPSYVIEKDMHRLPKVSLLVKLLKPSWFWIIVTLALYFIKPSPWDLEMAWWILSILLFIVIYMNRILDYMHTKYLLNEDQVQWWHGGLTSKLFVTKRKNVIEMSISQSLLQKKYKVGSVQTMNRSTPTHVEGVSDVPLEFVRTIQKWYINRQKDIQYHQS